MIVVYTEDGERIECPDANRYKTDEHNNLEVLCGPENRPQPVACFNADWWMRVLVEGGDDGE